MATAAIAPNTKPNKTPKSAPVVEARVAKRFSILECLGRGAFANVFKAKDKKTNKTVALKEIRKGHDQVASPLGEYLLTKMLDHEFVVKTLDCIDTRNSLYIALELAPDGDLFSLLDPSGPGLSESATRRIVSQLATGVDYLHSKKIVHNDLKPENILISGDTIKLADFGLAAYHGSTRPGPAVGTGAYMAPETVCIKTKSEVYAIRKEHDMWALGVIMYACLYSDLGWNRASKDDPDYQIFLREGGVTGKLYPFSLLSKAMLRVMGMLLNTDPAARCSAADLAAFLKTPAPWFASQEGKQRKKVLTDHLEESTADDDDEECHNMASPPSSETLLSLA